MGEGGLKPRVTRIRYYARHGSDKTQAWGAELNCHTTDENETTKVKDQGHSIIEISGINIFQGRHQFWNKRRSVPSGFCTADRILRRSQAAVWTHSFYYFLTLLRSWFPAFNSLINANQIRQRTMKTKVTLTFTNSFVHLPHGSDSAQIISPDRINAVASFSPVQLF